MTLSDISTAYANEVLDEIVADGLWLAALKMDLTEVGTAVSGAPSSGQYNRVALTANAAASKVVTNNGIHSITMPVGLTADTKVPYVGVFKDQTGGSAAWYLPHKLSKFEALAATDDTISTGEAHGFSADHRVIFDDVGSALPAGLSSWKTPTDPYYVLSSGLTSTAFKVSTSSGGSAVDITAAGGLIVRRIMVQGFNESQVLQIADAALSIALG